ncbi:hypothetical protein [Hymenobacter sp. GOD-10R]|uniref:hypothetical protein n=1 Tax=Hymenobacter sp. GOD-10R TaxID=3093922 RepID=UPI002D775503|nr:hypothetical protein [Hymenobacter sp. GOD-10R]WRQ29609.1 hypothetical protein SD425_04955 [Hymenobacter sp. GOD-10R]
MEDKTENPRNNESQVTDGADNNTTGMQAKMGAGVSNTLANSATQAETPAMNGTPNPNQDASSSESLVDSEMSVGKGSIGGPAGQQPNKEATPDDVQPGTGESQEQQERKQHSDSEPSNRYGGNFGNSVQPIYQDDDRRENQISGASRGEFGTQDHGNTQGGYGNQFRATNESGNYSLTDGLQSNSYQTYNGRDDTYRQESRNPNQVVYGQDNLPYEQLQPNAQAGNDGSTYLNDNGSGYGRGRGYSADYGTSSLTDSNMGTSSSSRSGLGDQQRNQNEDQNSSRGGYDNQDRTQGGNGQQTNRREREESYNEAGGSDANSRGTYQQPSARDEQDDKMNRSGSGNGQGDYNGKSTEGFGSQGGSYDDEYASADPNNKQGAPVRGDYDNADKAKNYGADKREEYRGDDKEDYGSAPRRNQGRDAADSDL